MTDDEYGVSVERRCPWPFLGFLAGTVFGLIGVYSVFFYSRKPDLRLQIHKAPVISAQEEVPNLEILLNGNDVRKSRQGTYSIGIPGALDRLVWRTYYEQVL